MRLSPHLTFKGDCAAAFEQYQQTLGAKILAMLTYGESPMANTVAPERRGHVVHATLAIGEQHLLGADVPPDEYLPPRGFFLLLGTSDVAEAERWFHALAEGGSVMMPLQETFWSPRFGVVVDRFGVPWEISCDATR